MGLEPRLLHKTNGYTTNPLVALPREPEAVDADTQERISYAAARNARQAQLDEWRQRRQTIQQQIDWLRSRPDVHTQLRALQRQLDRIDRKLART